MWKAFLSARSASVITPAGGPCFAGFFKRGLRVGDGDIRSFFHEIQLLPAPIRSFGTRPQFDK